MPKAPGWGDVADELDREKFPDKLLRETLDFLAAANGKEKVAAKLAGVSLGVHRQRMHAARRRFTPEEVAAVVPDAGAVKRADEHSELGQLRRENEMLRQHLTDKRHAKPWKPVKVTKRKGRDDWVRCIIPDSHGSHVDKPAWAACMADIKALDPDEIVHLGDYMDCGGFLAQHQVLGYVAQIDECSYADDLEAWHGQLDELMSVAPRAKIHLLQGNHLHRIERWAVEESLGKKKDAQLLYDAICPENALDYKGRGIRYAKDGDFHDGVKTRGVIKLGKCFYTHGFAIGRTAAAAHARKIGGPICTGHGHRPYGHYDKTVAHGPFAAWSPGCLSDLNPRWRHTDPNDWGHGHDIQFVARSELFNHVHIPIIDGVSLLPEVMRGGPRTAPPAPSAWANRKAGLEAARDFLDQTLQKIH
jgi:hypothetical protein